MVARAGAVLAMAGALSGCYYFHLLIGEHRLLARARPIENVLQSGGLKPEEAESLRWVLTVREWAMKRLGLRGERQFTTFVDTGGKPMSWVVSASRKDRLEPFLWRFAFVGPAPYKGFFDRDLAERERAAIEELGYEAIVRPVDAFSTLGYLPDPVPSGFLSYSKAHLADLVIHEMVHSTVYAPGNADFNESLATFVAETAGRQLMVELFGEGSSAVAEFDERVRALRDREAAMQMAVDLADALYRSGSDRVLEEKASLFLALERATGRAVSNPILLLHRTYRRTEFWERVLTAAQGSWARFFEMVRQAALRQDPFEALSPEGALTGSSGGR